MKAIVFCLLMQIKGKVDFKNRTTFQVALIHEWWRLMKLWPALSWCRQQHLSKSKCFCSDRQLTEKIWLIHIQSRQTLRGEEICAAVVRTRNLKALEYVSEVQWQTFLREQSVAEVGTALHDSCKVSSDLQRRIFSNIFQLLCCLFILKIHLHLLSRGG